MMLAAARDLLVTDLTAAGLPRVFVEWPDRVAPPMAVVTPATGQWVTSAPFAEWHVFLDVALLVPRTSAALTDLEGMVEAVLSLDGWGSSGVEGPGVVTVGAVEMMGTVVHLDMLGRL